MLECLAAKYVSVGFSLINAECGLASSLNHLQTRLSSPPLAHLEHRRMYLFSRSKPPQPAQGDTSTAVLGTATASAPREPAATPRSDAAPPSSCPGCGADLPALDRAHAELVVAQARIAELEEQLRQLNHKASSAVERWASYEAELSRLRASQTPSPPAPSLLQAAPARLSALLSARKTPSPTPLASSPSTTEDLLEALTREQTLRREAEGRLSATSREVEELSASLFEQANDMVADERRARARLEERVGELERRDVDKRRRLERLELAVDRIERVRSLLEDK